jgi:hypothetical protein
VRGVSVQVSCPGCAGPITFRVGSSIVAVCPYCNSLVARGDRGIESLGKVADLMETESPLELGLKGRFEWVPFELVGRAQIGHEAGGVWDEWYAAFADGRWGWLAEAQGRFYLTFQMAIHSSGGLPSFEDLHVGQHFKLAGDVPLVVAEKGQGRALGAKGEIPYRLVPDTVYHYADLSGPHGEFATLDYTESAPVFYLGHELPLSQLGFPPTSRLHEHEARQVRGTQLSCPQCGGALALRAPDKTQHVTCPNCAALLDVSQGQLRFLTALTPGQVEPILQIGSHGRFEDTDFVVIGFLRRSVTSADTTYPWDEYLLYNPEAGFRWLVCSDWQWSYVRPIPPGLAESHGRAAFCHGDRFKLFQRDMARVDYVMGEFYWKVMVGEEAQATDYIHPPEMLSREVSRAGTAEEVNWSLGTYLPHRELARIFGVKDLHAPAASSVAPNQPFLYKQIYLSWAFLSAAAFVLGAMLIGAGPRRTVFEDRFQIGRQAATQPVTIFTQPFTLSGRHNVQVTAEAPFLDNAWLDVEGDLVKDDDEAGMYQTFSVPVEYYHGTDGGESWSEGSRHSSAYLSALPAGSYTLRLEFQADPKLGETYVNVRVREGVPRFLYWILTLIALAIIPVAVAINHFSFERRRWANSDFSPFHSSSD